MIAEIKIQNPDVTPIVDIPRSDGTAIYRPREQTTSRLSVTDMAGVMADRDSNDQSKPSRFFFVPLRAYSMRFNSQLPTTIRLYARRLDALRR